MAKQYNPKTGARGIEWCDETRNVFGGCIHRCRWLMPDGSMAMCYAEDLAENGLAKGGYPHGFENHYYREKNLGPLVAGREPQLIFMDSMSDLFGNWVPDDQLEKVLRAMGTAPRHTYQSLTKAPGRLKKYMHLFPRNLWVGVSSPPDYFMPAKGHVEDFDGLAMKPANPMPEHAKIRFLQNTLSILKDVKAATGNITWMSWEPVSWDMAPHITVDMMPDWVIIGAASKGKKYYQPLPEHIAPLLDLCDAAGTAVFFKGNIKPMFDAHDLGSARLNRWREDFPIGANGPSAAVIQRQEIAHEKGWALNTFLLNWERNHAPVGKPIQGSFF